MTIKKCDICGKAIEPAGTDSFGEQQFFGCSVDVASLGLCSNCSLGLTTCSYDLCDDCAKKLLEVLDGNRTL